MTKSDLWSTADNKAARLTHLNLLLEFLFSSGSSLYSLPRLSHSLFRLRTGFLQGVKKEKEVGGVENEKWR